MSVTVDMRGILLANSGTPIYASNYKNGDRGSTAWQLAEGHYQSYITPIITHPRPDTETNSKARHRVNYTGQTYRIPVAVHGGAWPFYYELLSYPSGMTIGNQLTLSGGSLVAGNDYGIITYPNSVAGTYTITVRVTDQNGVVNTVSWQLVVGTSGWNFLDTSAGVNGSGTLASPYNTFSSITNGNPTLIRAGSVDMEQKVLPIDLQTRVLMPYGNESVTLIQAASTVGNNAGAGDFWCSGCTLKITAPRNYVNQFFRFEGMSRVVLFENTFDYESIDYQYVENYSENASVIMWTQQGVAEASTANAWYCVVMKNAFKNVHNRDAFIGYSMRYSVFERNSMENCTTTGTGHGFYPKTNVSQFTFRANFSIGTTNTQKLLRIDAYYREFVMDYFDVSYNNYRYYGDIEGAIGLCHEFVTGGTHRWIYRNTLWSNNAGAAALYLRGLTSSDFVTASNNVFVCNGTNTNGVRTDQFDGILSNTGYVTGNTSAGILDSNNKLAGGYVSNLGTKGAQIL